MERLAVQHPLNDTDNSMFLWAQLKHQNVTHLILMSTLPNDVNEQHELTFIPRFSYAPPNCFEFLQFHAVVLSRHQAMTLGNSDDANDDDSSKDSDISFAIRESARFNQLMLFLYTERNNNEFTLRVSSIARNLTFCFREAFLTWTATILDECHVKQCLTVRQLNNADLFHIFVHPTCRLIQLELL